MEKDWSKHFRKTDLELREPVETALAAADRVAALRTLTAELLAQGHGKSRLYDAFFNQYLRLRIENRELEEELIADYVLDPLSGWS